MGKKALETREDRCTQPSLLSARHLRGKEKKERIKEKGKEKGGKAKAFKLCSH